MKLEACPNCQYVSPARGAYCPVCGTQLGYPLWKKVGAWALLILIGYGWVQCQLKMVDLAPNKWGAKPSMNQPEALP